MIHPLVIVAIETTAAIFFLIALFFGYQRWKEAETRINIWFSLLFVIFVAFLMTLFNAAEWWFDESPLLDVIGEQLSILFSFLWIYIAARLSSEKNIC